MMSATATESMSAADDCIEPQPSPAGLISYQQIPSVRVNPVASMEANVERIRCAFEEMGDVLRVRGVGARAFCFRNPGDVQQIYREHTHKSNLVVSRVKYVMGNGIFSQTGGDAWKERRRVVSKALPKSEDPQVKLAALVPCTDELVEQLNDLQPQTDIDLRQYLACLVTDYTFRAFYSTNLGVEAEKAGDAFHYVMEHFLDPVPLWVPTASNIRFKQSARALRHIMQHVVDRRRAQQSDSPNDVLSVLLESCLEDEAVDQMVSIFSGTCVLIGSLAWMLYELAKSPAAQQKLADEISSVVGERPITFEDLAQLPYATMLFSETLRLYPAAWMTPRVCQAEARIGAHAFPAKTVFLPMVYLLHRHPEFWESPNDFQPERFAGEYPTSAYFPFGGGGRMCPGASLAPLIAQYLVARLVQQFEIQLPPDAPEVEPRFKFELSTSRPVRIRVASRN